MSSRWPLVVLTGLAAAAGAWVLADRAGTRQDDGPAGTGPSALADRGAHRGDVGPRRSPAGGGRHGAGVRWLWSVVVDSGGGRVGPWRMNRSDWRYVDDPAVALAPSGDAAVVWVDQARKRVLFRRYGPDGRPRLAAPVDVSRSPDVFSWLPRVAVGGDDGGRVYVLWQEIVFSGGTHGGEAYFARSTDGGRTFGEPVNLSNTRAGVGKGRLSPGRWHNGSLDLAADADGGLHAAWTAYEGGLWTVRSRDGGETFSEPLEIVPSSAERPARAPALAVGPDAAVHLAWALGGRPAGGLRLVRSTDGGRSFGAPSVLFEEGGHADAPALAVDGRGTVHLAWAESPPGRAGAHRVRYARSPAGTEGFGPPVTVAAPAGRVAGVHFPSLDVDSAGNPYLVWERFPEGRGGPRGLGFSASVDGGRTFREAGVVPGTRDPAYSANGSLQGLLMRKLSVGPSGEVAVVNSSFEPGDSSLVRLVRGRADGHGRRGPEGESGAARHGGTGPDPP